ncbi:hypothetical protein SDC9_212770 [bioreactor metagenome]|uniref:Uncharacterized protein n=1 Tax=bioreactor metagenome TaxID=1076179 RepID=A0A645JMY4_9ZZZZ
MEGELQVGGAADRHWKRVCFGQQTPPPQKAEAGGEHYGVARNGKGHRGGQARGAVLQQADGGQFGAGQALFHPDPDVPPEKPDLRSRDHGKARKGTAWTVSEKALSARCC